MQRADSLKRPWCWERLRAGGEGDNRGWDDWMASPSQWTWVWVDCRSWWWTGRPGMLQFMGSQSWTWLSYWSELNWTMVNQLPFEASLSLKKLKELISPVSLLHVVWTLIYYFWHIYDPSAFSIPIWAAISVWPCTIFHRKANHTHELWV